MINRSSTIPTDALACEDGILAPRRRAALLRNKTAILDALVSAGIRRLKVEFEELPFGCLIDRSDAFGDAGRFALPDLQIRYAEPGRRRHFRHRQHHLLSALSKMLDDLLSDDRCSSTAAEGILQIDVACRTFLIAGQTGGFQRRSFQRLY